MENTEKTNECNKEFIETNNQVEGIHNNIIPCKKIVSDVDNFSESEINRLLIIQTIQGMYSEGVKIREIAKILKMNRNTVKKYLEGNPENLCRFNTSSKISLFREEIIQLLKEGYTQTDVVRKIKEYGYDSKNSNARMYIQKVIKVEKLEVNKYSSEVTCASSCKESRRNI